MWKRGTFVARFCTGLRSWSFAATVVGIGLSAVRPADGFPIQMRIDVAQQPTTGGNIEYQIRMSGFQPVGGYTAQLVAPDGAFYFQNQQPVTAATLADFENRFIGEWKIRETPPGSGSTTEYRFTFASPLPAAFHETPTIITPQNGATVPKDLFVAWSYPSGAIPSGRSIAWGGASSSVPTDFGPGSTPEATLHLDLAGSLSKQVTVRAGSFALMTSNFSGVTLVSGTPSINEYSVSGGFSNYSAPVTVTVIPEPGAIVLAALACFAMAVAIRPR